MRDTTVRQDRIPHTLDTLSMDCNVHIDELTSILTQKTEDPEMCICISLFELFLQGRSYNDLGVQYQASSYAVRQRIRRAYKWLRLVCAERVR